MNNTEIQAARDLDDSLRHQPWYVSTGMVVNPDDKFEIIVYVTAPAKARKVVPAIFRTFPVTIRKISGRPRPL